MPEAVIALMEVHDPYEPHRTVSLHRTEKGAIERYKKEFIDKSQDKNPNPNTLYTIISERENDTYYKNVITGQEKFVKRYGFGPDWYLKIVEIED